MGRGGSRSGGRGLFGSSGSGSSGLGGFVFGTGVGIRCPADDTSFFCRFSKVFNFIMMIIVLIVIGYLIYTFVGVPKFRGGAVQTLFKTARLV